MTAPIAVAGLRITRDVQYASVRAFHVGIGISASLVALGGLLGLAGIRNPQGVVLCEHCAGGQLGGQPLDAGPLDAGLQKVRDRLGHREAPVPVKG